MFWRITVYYLVALCAAGLFNLLQGALGLDPNLLTLAQFGPGVAVLVLLLLFRQTRLSAGFSLQPFVLQRIGLGLGALLLLFGLACLGYALTGRAIPFTPLSELDYSFPLLVLTMFIGAVGEELGWRAYLQPELERRFRTVVSSVIVGLLWGLWHPAYFAQGLGFAGLFIVTSVALSVILGQLLKGARGNNLLIATVFHAALNLGLILLFDEEQGRMFALQILTLSSGAVALLTCAWGLRGATPKADSSVEHAEGSVGRFCPSRFAPK